MGFKDIILTPFCLLILYIILFVIKRKYIKDPIQKKYFIPAVSVKVLGALLLGIIYQFYYGGGDTFVYFTKGSGIIWEAFKEEPITAFKILFEQGGGTINPQTSKYTIQIPFYNDPASFFIVKLSAFLGFFTLHTYTLNSILFGLIAFSSFWAIFTLLLEKYPHLHKKLAFTLFFVPSVFLWGSGLLKDSITMGALGWCFYSCYQIIVNKDRKALTFLILIVSAYVLYLVKIYILLCFLPATFIWAFTHYSYKIKNRLLKLILTPLLLCLAIGMGILSAKNLSMDNSRYNLESIILTSQMTSEWLSHVSKQSGGAFYDLGEIEFSLQGILKKAPAAINVTLFRPYIWEANNILMFFTALESLLFLFLTVKVIKDRGIKSITAIFKEPIIVFGLVFSLSFAFAVGISTVNFGTLVRYKIPLMPFYLLALFLIQNKGKIVTRPSLPR
ncbi:hypothetical protein RCC89_06975 [Cytophagaceae bacterium ABcell3]|nr:hypothetical protein RCC89_06975 [Cytophagaceae bacterium ABcell3]